MNRTTHKINDGIKSSRSSIKELCSQSPFLLINTPCGIGKYKFNKVGYDNTNDLILEYNQINIQKPKKYLLNIYLLLVEVRLIQN